MFIYKSHSQYCRKHKELRDEDGDKIKANTYGITDVNIYTKTAFPFTKKKKNGKLLIKNTSITNLLCTVY